MYTVYKTELMKNMGKLKNINSYTATKFTMHLFNVSYLQKFNAYSKDTPFEEFDVLLRIIFIVKGYNGKRLPKFQLLIVDEYTVLTPEVLVAICLFCRLYKKHLVLVGDRCQQNAINRSPQHGSISNYFFLVELCDRAIVLNKPVRCVDSQYNEKLSEYRDLLIKYGRGDTPLNAMFRFVF
jgi:hypothetical protein